MNKYLVFILVFMFALTGVSAETDFVFKEDNNVSFTIPVYANNYSRVDINTACYLTLKDDIGNIVIDDRNMTRQTNGEYNTTLFGTEIDDSGEYEASVFCTNGNDNGFRTFSLLINPTGIRPSEERTSALTRTITIFFLLAVLSFFALFFVRSYPVKFTLFILMVWFVLMGINVGFVSLQDEVVNPNIENFMSFFFVITTKAHYFMLFGIAVIWMITFFANFQKIKESKQGGDDYYDY